MQFKSFAALFFTGMVLAAPADTDNVEAANSADSDFELPHSIAVVLATAVPHSFWAEATNTAAFLSQIEQGFVSNSWPSWYSSFPDSVKEYVTTAVEGYYPSFASSIAAEATRTSASGSAASSSLATATSSISGSSISGSSTGSSTGSSSASESTPDTTGSSSSASPTGSDAASSSASASASASSSTSDGGAAPTGVAMSLAGAAGVLGLALAL